MVDTPAYQRLRGVQQLAYTHLVYPGARHSRFEHCLGAAHVAGRLARGAKAEDDNVKNIQLAALVHDIGHGPFSHVSEGVFVRLTGRRKSMNQSRRQSSVTIPMFDGPWVTKPPSGLLNF